MQPIITTATLILTGFTTVSCGSPDGNSAEACPTLQLQGGIASTDADVSKYEGATRITGRLAIVGPDVQSLQALACLEEIDELVVTESSVRNLSGLERLHTISRELAIFENEFFSTTHGLDSLTAASLVIVEDNPLLEDLWAFRQLTTVRSLSITRNSSITDLDELSTLARVDDGTLLVLGNQSLRTISGMTALVFAQDGISVAGNTSLVECDDFVLAEHVEWMNVEHMLQSDPGACGG